MATALKIGFGMDCIDDAAQQLVAEHWAPWRDVQDTSAEDILQWLRFASRSLRSQGAGQYRQMCRLLVEQQELRHAQAAEMREEEARRMHCVRQTFLGESGAY